MRKSEEKLKKEASEGKKLKRRLKLGSKIYSSS